MWPTAYFLQNWISLNTSQSEYFDLFALLSCLWTWIFVCVCVCLFRVCVYLCATCVQRVVCVKCGVCAYSVRGVYSVQGVCMHLCALPLCIHEGPRVPSPVRGRHCELWCFRVASSCATGAVLSGGAKGWEGAGRAQTHRRVSTVVRGQRVCRSGSTAAPAGILLEHVTGRPKGARGWPRWPGRGPFSGCPSSSGVPEPPS